MTIEQEIHHWDGKSVDEIDTIYHRHHDDNSFVAQIIELSARPALQRATTGLLRRYLESGKILDPGNRAQLFRLLPGLEHWESRLHVLQCLPFTRIAKSDKKAVETFLRHCLADSNKFVRAWAYNGFYEISMQYPEYKNETKAFFEMAMRDEAPSVKARIRNIMKTGF